MSSALKAVHAFPPLGIYSPSSEPAVIGSADRSSKSWPESFVKMRKLIATELHQKDADDEFWGNELVAVHDAQKLYGESVEELDRAIARLQAVRSLHLQNIASRLPAQSNLPAFLRTDNPSGYLCW